ncbi:MAG: GAF domain-containing protein, partial [Anaerolineae bacterium]
MLEEVRRLLGAVASSVWLVDRDTGELVCHQTIGTGDSVVRGWRLAPGQGLAGWVLQHRQNLIVPDARTDARHFKGVDEQVGTEMRSILIARLQVKGETIGLIYVVDQPANRFKPADMLLVESLAATAAMAVENARLYRQAQHDAETRAVLLNEVNHRVKNNLAAIIGLLYVEKQHAQEENLAAHQTILDDMIHRIQGLAAVHGLLSARKWTPLPLSDLTAHIIRSMVKLFPTPREVSVAVAPSPTRVMPKQANSLALVINELVTNT